jgi:hypothetical protein
MINKHAAEINIALWLLNLLSDHHDRSTGPLLPTAQAAEIAEYFRLF